MTQIKEPQIKEPQEILEKDLDQSTIKERYKKWKADQVKYSKLKYKEVKETIKSLIHTDPQEALQLYFVYEGSNRVKDIHYYSEIHNTILFRILDIEGERYVVDKLDLLDLVKDHPALELVY